MSLRSIGNMDQVGIVKGFMTYLSALTKNTDEDKAVMISTNDTVALVTAGLNFTGVVRTIGDGPSKLAGVQEDGYAELTYNGSAPVVGMNYLVGGAVAGTIAVADEVAIKQVAITVATGGGNAVGSSAADPDLVGGKIVGVVFDTNNDQLVDDVTLNADGSVTVTLAAAATADNKFKVAVQKVESAWPKRYMVRSVDATNSKCTILLG